MQREENGWGSIMEIFRNQQGKFFINQHRLHKCSGIHYQNPTGKNFSGEYIFCEGKQKVGLFAFHLGGFACHSLGNTEVKEPFWAEVTWAESRLKLHTAVGKKTIFIKKNSLFYVFNQYTVRAYEPAVNSVLLWK